MKAPMSERKLQKKCLQYARARGVYARKVETPSHAGFPDCVFHYGGRTVYVEFKSPTGRGVLSPLQKKEHERLAAVGLPVLVLDDYHKFCSFIQRMTGRPTASAKEVL